MPPKKNKRKTATKGESSPSKKVKSDSKSDDGVEHLVSDDMKFPDLFPTSSGQVKIISWNVNGLRALLKKENLLKDYVASENPDILCLQETKIDESKIVEFKSMLPGYQQYWSCAEKLGYSGTALFTKEKPLTVQYGLGIKKHDNEGRCIIAEYPKFWLVNCYVVNAGQTLERLDYRTKEWDVDLRNKLKELEKKKPVVLTGDLNVAHQEIDIHNPKGNHKSAGFTPEERKGFTELLDSGFVDTYRLHHPDLPQYTYWGYRFNARNNNKGWRLDYFVLSKHFVSSAKKTFVRGTVGGSDHCPLGIILEP